MARCEEKNDHISKNHTYDHESLQSVNAWEQA